MIITEQQGYGRSVISKNMSVAKDEQRFKIIHIETILYLLCQDAMFLQFKTGITLQDVKGFASQC